MFATRSYFRYVTQPFTSSISEDKGAHLRNIASHGSSGMWVKKDGAILIVILEDQKRILNSLYHPNHRLKTYVR